MIAEEIFNAAAPLSSDVGASALSASLATGPNALGGLDLLVVGVGELASLLGAGGDEGSSVGDSARGDESEGGEVEGVEDFGAEDFGMDDFGADTRDDDLGTGTGEAFGVAAGDLLFFGDGVDLGKDALGAGEGKESATTSPATTRKMSARINTWRAIFYCTIFNLL
ncbi:Uncharacterized protein Fot_12292 [Forsythia ovata]|uniref:Uncharacterized protein n=1 Tax=Forsythia ovata TaxID=205694 RepID=A0ABD1WMA2_9LAMI